MELSVGIEILAVCPKRPDPIRCRPQSSSQTVGAYLIGKIPILCDHGHGRSHEVDHTHT